MRILLLWALDLLDLVMLRVVSDVSQATRSLYLASTHFSRTYILTSRHRMEPICVITLLLSCSTYLTQLRLEYRWWRMNRDSSHLHQDVTPWQIEKFGATQRCACRITHHPPSSVSPALSVNIPRSCLRVAACFAGGHPVQGDLTIPYSTAYLFQRDRQKLGCDWWNVRDEGSGSGVNVIREESEQIRAAQVAQGTRQPCPVRLMWLKIRAAWIPATTVGCMPRSRSCSGEVCVDPGSAHDQLVERIFDVAVHGPRSLLHETSTSHPHQLAHPRLFVCTITHSEESRAGFR